MDRATDHCSGLRADLRRQPPGPLLPDLAPSRPPGGLGALARRQRKRPPLRPLAWGDAVGRPAERAAAGLGRLLRPRIKRPQLDWVGIPAPTGTASGRLAGPR